MEVWTDAPPPHTDRRGRYYTRAGRWSYTPQEWQRCSCTSTRNSLYCTFRGEEMARCFSSFSLKELKRNWYNGQERKETPSVINTPSFVEVSGVPDWSTMLCFDTGRESGKLRPLTADFFSVQPIKLSSSWQFIITNNAFSYIYLITSQMN